MHICTQVDYKKKLPTFLCVSKVDLKLELGEHNFRNNPVYVSFLIFGSKVVFFLLVFLWVSPFFINS